jgi:O-antigen/teichoic acid export membrane protein
MVTVRNEDLTFVESNSNPVNQRKQLPRAVRNVLSNWGAYIFAFIVNFFLAPYIVRRLGQTGYGVWTLMASLTGYLGLLDMGVRGAVTRYVARYHAVADHKEASRITSTALQIFVTAGIVAAFASVIMAFTVVNHFRIDPIYLPAARTVLILAGMNVGLSLVNGVFGGVITSLQRFDLANRVEISNTFLRSLAILVALRSGGGVVALGIIQLVSSVAAGLVLSRFAFRLYPELELQLGKWDWQRLSVLFSFSIYAFIVHVSLQLIWYTDTVVIGSFLPIGMVTYFAIAASLLGYARTLLSSIAYTLTPMASSMEAVGKEGELRRLTMTSSCYATIIMLPIAATFMIRGKTFIGLWMGRDYAALSGTVLQILVLAWLFNAGNGVTGAILMGISKHKAMAPMAAGEGILNLGLSIALVHPLGILGVAWGTTIPNLIQNTIVYPWYLCRTIGIPWPRYVLVSLLRPAAAMIPFAVLTYLVEHRWPATNLALFFTQVALVLPAAAAGFWFLVLDRTERDHYYQVWFLPFLRSKGWVPSK